MKLKKILILTTLVLSACGTGQSESAVESKRFWFVGREPGSQSYWFVGRGPGSQSFWFVGREPGSQSYWFVGRGPGSKSYWYTGRGPGSKSYWFTGFGPGSKTFWFADTQSSMESDFSIAVICAGLKSSENILAECDDL